MTALNFLRALVYGIIQGITEWLPISSTGHLILANEIPFFKLDGISKDFFNMFIVVIQLASILAVILICLSCIVKPPVCKTKAIPYAQWRVPRILQAHIRALPNTCTVR